VGRDVVEGILEMRCGELEDARGGEDLGLEGLPH
jgi:hypothetical protein